MATNNLTPDMEVRVAERAIQYHVQKEVEQYIHNLIKPKLDKTIKSLATDAVAKWAKIDYKSQLDADPLSMTTHIKVSFVEHIVKTVMKDSPISITTEDTTNGKH